MLAEKMKEYDKAFIREIENNLNSLTESSNRFFYLKRIFSKLSTLENYIQRHVDLTIYSDQDDQQPYNIKDYYQLQKFYSVPKRWANEYYIDKKHSIHNIVSIIEHHVKIEGLDISLLFPQREQGDLIKNPEQFLRKRNRFPEQYDAVLYFKFSGVLDSILKEANYNKSKAARILADKAGYRGHEWDSIRPLLSYVEKYDPSKRDSNKLFNLPSVYRVLEMLKEDGYDCTALVKIKDSLELK